jgi:hypothetical protein
MKQTTILDFRTAKSTARHHYARQLERQRLICEVDDYFNSHGSKAVIHDGNVDEMYALMVEEKARFERQFQKDHPEQAEILEQTEQNRQLKELQGGYEVLSSPFAQQRAREIGAVIERGL